MVFLDLINYIYNLLIGNKRTEKKRLHALDLSQRQLKLMESKDLFIQAIKNGTSKYDVLSISYKTSDFTKKYWPHSFSGPSQYKLIYLCDDNSLESFNNSYELSGVMKDFSYDRSGRYYLSSTSEYYSAYINASNDEEVLSKGFKIVFVPTIKDGKLLATSFRNDIRSKAELIYIFDIENVKLNDINDIEYICDILINTPRDFYGGNIDNIVNIIKSKI